MEHKKDGFKGQKAIIIPQEIISRYCVTNALINGIYITAIGYYPKAKFHYRERTTGIDEHILIYTQDGHGWIEIDNQKNVIHPGDFVIIPAGLPHSYGADENNPWSIYWAHTKGHTADALVHSMVKKTGSYKSTVSHNQKRIDTFEQIYKNLERGYGHDNLSYTNICFMGFMSSFLFCDAFDESLLKENSSDVVNLSIEFMQRNLHAVPDLKTIAAEVNVSVSHYSCIFKKKTGFSPMEYFTHLKIQKACQYLQFTTLRIFEIALAIGIEDPYYFSRLFTKIMSISPKVYRTNHLH